VKVVGSRDIYRGLRSASAPIRTCELSLVDRDGSSGSHRLGAIGIIYRLRRRTTDDANCARTTFRQPIDGQYRELYRGVAGAAATARRSASCHGMDSTQASKENDVSE